MTLSPANGSATASTSSAHSLILEAQGLTKLYGVVLGVSDITLALPPGVWGLLGPNGSGKSTFLKLVTGQLRPTEGTVRVLGERPWGRPALFRRIGYCPEHDSFYASLTGLAFVTALARLSGLGREAAREAALRALASVRATEFMGRAIATYSKGMRQRVKVAQAIAHDPDLVILDEPLLGTDPIGRRELIDIVRGLGAEGKSVIVASHVLHEVQAMTESFLLIYRGRLLATGRVDEIRALIDRHPHRIAIRCDRPRELATRMLSELPVDGVELDLAASRLQIRTRDPSAFYAGVPQLAIATGVRIDEMVSEDDHLEAVFRYLVRGA